MKYRRNRNNGFTLIEIVITLFVITIFFGLIAGITQFSVTFFRNEDSQVASQSSLRIIATQFEKDIRKYVGTGTEFSNPNTGEYRIAADASATIIYLFQNNNVFRNGTLIGSNIDIFDPGWDGTNSFELIISSFKDGYDRENNVKVRIVIRAGE